MKQNIFVIPSEIKQNWQPCIEVVKDDNLIRTWPELMDNYLIWWVVDNMNIIKPNSNLTLYIYYYFLILNNGWIIDMHMNTQNTMDKIWISNFFTSK